MIKVMPKGSAGETKKANRVAEECFRKKETSFLLFVALAKVIKGLWPKKTTAHVRHFTGASERNVRFWLACSTRMPLEAVTALLRTDDGYDILEAIMGDSRVEWWVSTQQAHELRRARRQIAAAQRRVDELKARQRQIDLFEQ